MVGVHDVGVYECPDCGNSIPEDCGYCSNCGWDADNKNGGKSREFPDDPDTLFSCTECDWVGPAEDVEWGDWIPAHYRGQRMEPTKNDCPECGAEVEHQRSLHTDKDQ